MKNKVMAFVAVLLLALGTMAYGGELTSVSARSSLLSTPLKTEAAPATDGAIEAAILGPAPPLTYLQVYAVISSNHPQYEYIAKEQYATVYDHGGAELYVVTVEYGYGTSAIARMSGNNVSLLQSQRIVDSSGIIIGWYYWWNCNGYQSGQFTYQSTSINYPYNTMSDWISIL